MPHILIIIIICIMKPVLVVFGRVIWVLYMSQRFIQSLRRTRNVRSIRRRHDCAMYLLSCEGRVKLERII